MEKLYEVSHVAVNGHQLSFKVNGIAVICNLAKISEVLANATQEQIANVIVDSIGVGFHWPALDEDLSVNGILRELRIKLPVTNQEEKVEHAELV
jgi:hypothetical protein